MNDFVVKALEIIFGIWLVNYFMSFLFGIDVIDYVKVFFEKLIYGKTPSNDD